MAEYLVLIYEDENGWAGANKETWDRTMQDHGAFAEKNGAALRGGNALQPTSTATTIRKNGNGNATVTDGPFVETKEALGGYYLIEAPDLDAAVAIARYVPAPFGGIEVRPIMVFS